MLKSHSSSAFVLLSNQFCFSDTVIKKKGQAFKSPRQSGIGLSNSQRKTARKLTSPRPRIKSSADDFVAGTLITTQRVHKPGNSNKSNPDGFMLWLLTTSDAVNRPSDHIVAAQRSRHRKYHCIWAGFRLKRRSVLIPRMLASHHWPFDQARKPNIRTCGSSRTEQDYHHNDILSVG